MMHKAVMWLRRGALLFFKIICQKSRSHGQKIVDFDTNWAFPDCNSSLNSPMALKWCTKLYVIMWYRRDALLFFKVICQISRSLKTKKIANFDPNWAFLDCNSIQFEFTDVFEMMHKAWRSIERGDLLFFEVIHQISRWHGPKEWLFESNFK